MLKQHLQMKLGQKLAPQQIQLMKLIQLHTLEFEEELERELEENPALERAEDKKEDDYEDLGNDYEDEGSESIDTDFDVNEYIFDDEPSYKTASSNYSADDEEFDNQSLLTEGQSLYDYLLEQINLINIDEEDLKIAEYIIGNLDTDGYLRRETKSIVDDLAFSQGIYTTKEKVEDILENYVQKLDPSGVGARNLQECLLLQIEKKVTADKAVSLAANILRHQFDALTNKHYNKIMQKYDVDEDDLKDALDEISHLSPKVGGNFDTQTITINQEIIPDFVIQVNENKKGGQPDVIPLLNSKNAPTLRVSEEYKDILTTYSHDKTSAEHKQAALFIKQKLDAAKWYIDAINQRQNTLLQTITAIVKLQKEYFITGDDKSLKPMILKDVADITGFDISTISRVVKSKYADTPNGIVYLKDLFSDSLTNDDGEEVSTKEIKQHLQEAIDKENKRKPYTDDALVGILKEKGYNIARRTIAKYREQLNIPVARLRKEL